MIETSEEDAVAADSPTRSGPAAFSVSSSTKLSILSSRTLRGRTGSGRGKSMSRLVLTLARLKEEQSKKLPSLYCTILRQRRTRL